jgi:HK97 family phage major capsid protein
MRKSLRDAIMREVKAARDIADTAAREERELTDVERSTIEDYLGKAAAFETNAKQEKEMRERMSALTADLGIGGDDADNTKSARLADVKRLSLGHTFVNSAEYKSLLASVPTGQFSEKMRVQSAAVGFKDLLTGADHDTSAGSLVREDYRGLQDAFYQRPLTLRDIVGSGNTTSDTIEYVRLVSVTNNAAPVAEATSSAVIDGTTVTPVMGGLKPESGMDFEKDTTVVKTIAHWIPATKRALADAAQIRTLIDQFLRYGLEEELEDQILTGDGVGENFLGLANTSGVQIQAAPTATQDVFDVTRIARRKVRIGGRANPTAFVMNPIDWEAVELRRNDMGDFYAGGPFNMATPRLWGLPVIESEVIPPGTAWVGAWNMAVLYDREQAGIQVTDSHNDFFTRNLVAILAEMRAAFAVLRPAAFVRIALA